MCPTPLRSWRAQGCRAKRRQREAGSGFSMEAYPESGMYVCLEFYAVAARLEEHMPEPVRVGQSWGREALGSSLKRFDGQERLVVGRSRPSQGTKREISAACDAPAAPWRPWTLGAVYRGVALKLYGLSSSTRPRRRAPTGARPLGQSYGSLAPCGFLLAGQHSSSHRD